jgi:integration host factor subunit beta
VLAVFDHIVSALARGQRVELRGFGSFTTRRHKAHIGRNPRTGEGLSVIEKDVPYFRAGRELVGRLNRSNGVPSRPGRRIVLRER